MNEMLRKRMSATQQASEQQTGDKAYEQIFSDAGAADGNAIPRRTDLQATPVLYR